MKSFARLTFLLCLSQWLVFESFAQQPSGELKQWHRISLDFEGPTVAETDEENPFLFYQLNVLFTHQTSNKKYKVPGFFAADGNAAETGARSGNVWRVHFAPDEVGVWTYEVQFLQGPWAAIRSPQKLTSAKFMDGQKGQFTIAASDKSAPDFRSRGRLDYIGKQYLQFQGDKSYFLKCGSDAPENLLAYADFDGNFKEDGIKDDLIKQYKAHIQDWTPQDPTWQDNKGKGLIGAINYLHHKGMNAFSFLTMNIEGDDRNVFPYIDYHQRDRFDCSKLDQWEIIFSHADRLGMFLHFKTMEVENQGLLDNGGIGLYTKLYYRELIARFGHHLALNWNLCEEMGDWVNKPKTLPVDPENWKVLAEYVHSIDAYHHPIVIHNGVWYDELYGKDSKFTGASLQTHKSDFRYVHRDVLRIIEESKAAGKPWAVACDEPGDAQHALLPDAEDPHHDLARKNGLWGAFMAGAWGTEWYFGYQHDHSDLTCEDFRSRDRFWNQGKHCLDFFRLAHLPLTEMENMDDLLNSDQGYVLGKMNSVYLIYLKQNILTSLNIAIDELSDYQFYRFDPRNGGKLMSSKNFQLDSKNQLIIQPEGQNDNHDWVYLMVKK